MSDGVSYVGGENPRILEHCPWCTAFDQSAVMRKKKDVKCLYCKRPLIAHHMLHPHGSQEAPRSVLQSARADCEGFHPVIPVTDDDRRKAMKDLDRILSGTG